MHNILNLT